MPSKRVSEIEAVEENRAGKVTNFAVMKCCALRQAHSSDCYDLIKVMQSAKGNENEGEKRICDGKISSFGFKSKRTSLSFPSNYKFFTMLSTPAAEKMESFMWMDLGHIRFNLQTCSDAEEKGLEIKAFTIKS